MNRKAPLALFDSLENITTTKIVARNYINFNNNDCKQALAFLKSYDGSKQTFNAYRREVERLLQWSWIVAEKSIKNLKRDDIEKFIHFCKKPLKSWIGVYKAQRFRSKDGTRVPNKDWRPFVAQVSKAAFRNGKRPDKAKFAISDTAIKETLAILSSFYNFMLQEEYAKINPVALIRQRSKFIRTKQTNKAIRRLTTTQWDYVIKTALELSEKDPHKHERSLFIMTALYSMYLRISELSASERWTPQMNHFYRDHDGAWWFKTVGKGNKERDIAVSDAMLKALKRWRKYLNLTVLPTPGDQGPLLPKNLGSGPIKSTNTIRLVVQACFDAAMTNLRQDGLSTEADALLEATVHWLRHTGISDDVKYRPREHVRDDAGHSSGAITDRYIDVELKARHKSAKRKTVVSDSDV